MRNNGMTTSSLPESIFLAALKLTNPTQRAAYLNRAYPGEDDLRHRMERLLEACPRVGNSLKQPIADEPADESIPSGKRRARAGTRPRRVGR